MRGRSRSLRLAITVSFLMIAHCTPGGDSGGGGSGSGGKAGGSGAGGASAGGGGAGVSGSGGSGGGGAIATGGTGGGTGGTGGSGGAGPSTGGQSGGGQGGSGSGSGSGGSGGGAADAPGGETPAASGPGCAGVTAKFCDDWDKLAAGQAPTGEFTISASGGGTVLVDTAQKFSGANSLHFKSAGGGKVMLLFTKQFPINDQHGRLMLYMPKKPTTGSHWDIIQSHSPTNHWEPVVLHSVELQEPRRHLRGQAGRGAGEAQPRGGPLEVRHLAGPHRGLGDLRLQRR
jgi:hypothetical protein